MATGLIARTVVRDLFIDVKARFVTETMSFHRKYYAASTEAILPLDQANGLSFCEDLLAFAILKTSRSEGTTIFEYVPLNRSGVRLVARPIGNIPAL